MKLSVSMFEKLLVTTIIFVFCIVVLVQIFVNNNVLDTIKANEDGTPVSFEQSSTYITKGMIQYRFSLSNAAILLVNGEEVQLSNNDADQSIEIEVYDGDVLEVVNHQEVVVTFHLIDVTDNLSFPIEGSKIDCKKGITYLFKVKSEKMS